MAHDRSAPPAPSCSLGPDGLRDRAHDWHALVASAGVARSVVGGRLILSLASRPEVRAELERLVAAERSCCPFLELTVEDSGSPGGPLVLTVTAPSGAEEILGLPTTASPSGGLDDVCDR